MEATPIEYSMDIDEEGEVHFSIYTKDYECCSKISEFLYELIMRKYWCMSMLKKTDDAK